jgi:hypothetical protein
MPVQPAQDGAESHAGGRAVPAWVRAVDGLATGFLAIGACVALFGGFRVVAGGLRLSVTSELRIFLLAAALVAIRHALVGRPRLDQRWRASLSAFARSRAVAAAVPVTLASRIAVLFTGYMAVLTIGFATPAPNRIAPNEFLNLPSRGDAGWYLGIAVDGYRWSQVDRQQNVAFFPAYPMLVRAGGWLVGARPQLRADQYQPGVVRLAWMAVLVSVGAFFWALVYLYRLAAPQIGDERALVALALAASYPFAVFFSAPYTEALFMLCAAGAFFHVLHGQAGRAAIWGAIAGLTRPNGCFLAVPLGMLALTYAVPPLRAWSDAVYRGGPAAAGRVPRAKTAALLVAAIAPAVGILVHSAYVWTLAGRPFAWVEVQQRGWGRVYRGLSPLVTGPYEHIANAGLYEYTRAVPLDVLNSLAAILALGTLWALARRLGLAYALFIALNLGPPLVAGGVMSMGRFTSVMFPTFIYLGLALPERARLPAISAFAVGQGLAAVLFFTWRQMY